LASTGTNKQPLLVDRPLFDSVRVTTQTVGSASSNTLFVQGGQGPSILVDMDADLGEDNNSGGVVDSITIVRNDFHRAPDYTYTGLASSGVISLVSGQIVNITAVTGIATAPVSGVGFYTYTGATTLTGVNTALLYSGGTATGFSYNGVNYGYKPAVTFAFYHTRGTTTPIPGSGDYRLLFAKTVPADSGVVDCSDVMPQLSAPVVQAGNTTGLGSTAPLRNKGIYLERGDRIYVGVFPDGPNISGYTPGAHVIAEGGFF
tara:strand:- start:11153 stop:11932 length:780 start_codon:yes stop_codon:yes gene_type:complete